MVSEKADLVLLSENVFTSSARGMVRGGVAIRGNRIVAVGSRDEVLAHAGEGTEVVDYGDKLVMPGICDAHLHYVDAVIMQEGAFLFDCKSADECARTVYESYASKKDDYADGEWVTAFGFDFHAWDDPQPPVAADLDKYFPDRPVYIYDADGHGGWCNTKALEVAGVTKDTPDPPYGMMRRDEDGNPTGSFVEHGVEPFVKLAYNIPLAKEKRLVRDSGKILTSQGITSVMDMRPVANYEFGHVEVFEELQREHEFAIRYNYATELLADEEHAFENRRAHGDPEDLVFHAGVKEFMDGIVTSHTAVLLEPYTDMPDAPIWNPQMDFELAEKKIIEYQRDGFNVHLHAVGDGAVRKALDMYEAAIRANGKTASRLSVEHLDMSDPEDWPRLGEMGIVCSVQPQHLTLSPTLESDLYGPTVGPERSKNLWAFKSMMDNGAVLAFGTDWPCVPTDPRLDLYNAVTRRFSDGKPDGGWNPAQKLTLADSLTAYTYGGAYKLGKESVLGSLEAGKLADVIVWDCNLFDIDPEDIKSANVIRTIFNGESVYEA